MTTVDKTPDTWKPFLDDVTAQHGGADVTIEIADVDFGDQTEAVKLPLAYLEHDPGDSTVVVAVGGHDGRFPVALRHIVSDVRGLAVDTDDPILVRQVAISAAAGTKTIVTIHPKPELAP